VWTKYKNNTKIKSEKRGEGGGASRYSTLPFHIWACRKCVVNMDQLSTSCQIKQITRILGLETEILGLDTGILGKIQEYSHRYEEYSLRSGNM
jgi:hypothetical protein